MKRYSPDDGSGSTYMTESPTGEYVRWEEVEALLPIMREAAWLIEDGYRRATPFATKREQAKAVAEHVILAPMMAAIQALEHAKGE